MAVVRAFVCQSCGHYVIETVPNGMITNECFSCRQLEANMNRREHLNKLSAMTVEERLALIEAWIYDFKTEPQNQKY